MMTAVRETVLVSVNEFLAAERESEVKHEFMGGYVYAMAGARTHHNRIAIAFTTAMANSLRGRPCEAFGSDMMVRLRMPTHTRFYYPDGMVVCNADPADGLFQDHPTIIAEVLSESTRRIDEGEKRDAYFTISTLSAYLLIESRRPRVVVYHRTTEGFVPRIYDGLNAKIQLTEIGVELSLAELYERVDFDNLPPPDEIPDR